MTGAKETSDSPTESQYKVEIENGLTDDVSLDLYIAVLSQTPEQGLKFDGFQASVRANLLPDNLRSTRRPDRLLRGQARHRVVESLGLRGNPDRREGVRALQLEREPRGRVGALLERLRDGDDRMEGDRDGGIRADAQYLGRSRVRSPRTTGDGTSSRSARRSRSA